MTKVEVEAGIRRQLPPDFTLLSLGPVSTDAADRSTASATCEISLQAREDLVTEVDAAAELNRKAGGTASPGSGKPFSGPQAFRLFQPFAKKDQIISVMTELRFDWVDGKWSCRSVRFDPESILAVQLRSRMQGPFMHELGSTAAEEEIQRFIDLEKPVARETPARRHDAMRKAKAQMPPQILEFAK
ncbi:MAG: hypothetical protein V4726_21340 [Verrucomicrobiota bacterium]